MATYTPSQLRGTGSLTEELAGTKQLDFNNPSGSSYFTLESIRNSDGIYDNSSDKVAIGAYSHFSGSFTKLLGFSTSSLPTALVTSSYISSMVIPQGSGSFKYAPTTTVAANAARLKGTGEYTLTIS